jgi:hypothetical protein
MTARARRFPPRPRLDRRAPRVVAPAWFDASTNTWISHQPWTPAPETLR